MIKLFWMVIEKYI